LLRIPEGIFVEKLVFQSDQHAHRVAHHTTDRRTRIEESFETHRELHNTNAELAYDNQRLQSQLTEAQDDVIAVRLRQMIRDTTDQMEPT
jgi:hypothetical protein